MASGGVSPTAGAPSGAAGGDLSGTYPNPTVDLMAGGTITGPVVVDNATAGTSALTVDAVDASGVGGNSGVFRQLDGTVIAKFTTSGTAGSAADGQLHVGGQGIAMRIADSGLGVRVANTSDMALGQFIPGGGLILYASGFGNETLECDSADGTQQHFRVRSSGQVIFGAFVARVVAGAYFTSAHAAPADGTLSDGEVAMWFDQTDGVGNTKVMFKGKSADGTVKTAAVLLA